MSEIKIGRIPMGMYQTNCYFLYREDSKDIVVVDPADSGEYLFDALTEKGFFVKAILLTHGHFDHVYGVRKLKELSECKVYAPKPEEELLKNPHLNVSDQMGRLVRVEPDVFLQDNETLTLCDITFRMIHTPGHTAGSSCYYIEEAGFLIAGDTLFCQSVGRSDFPTGSEATLIRSIKEKLLCLPASTKVYPGHGDSTTIGFEAENNPFI